MHCEWQRLLVTAELVAELVIRRSKHRSPLTWSMAQERAGCVLHLMTGGHGFSGRPECRRDSATVKLFHMETQASGTAPTP